MVNKCQTHYRGLTAVDDSQKLMTMVKVLGFKVPARFYEEINEICERERITVSDMLYEVVAEFVENYKEFMNAEGKDARMWREH